jgi:uncharacterized protein YggT (Ycf19 family)
MIVLAIDRFDVANYLNALITVYAILILVRILISWIPRIPYNPALRAVLDFVSQVTDPYLNLFRRILPPLGGRGFALDISPIVALLALYVVGGLVVEIVRPG